MIPDGHAPHLEFSHKPIPIIDIYEDISSGDAKNFAESPTGKSLIAAVEADQAIVHYRFLYSDTSPSATSPSDTSTHKDFIVTALSALKAIERADIPVPGRTTLWNRLYLSIMAGKSPATPKNLAMVTNKLAHKKSLSLHITTYDDIRHNTYRDVVSQEGLANTAALDTLQLGRNQLRDIVVRSAGKNYFPRDIVGTDFISMLTQQLTGKAQITAEIFIDLLCPISAQFINSAGGKELWQQTHAGRVKLIFRLMNFLDHYSPSHSYSTRAATALYDLYSGNFSPLQKFIIWQSYLKYLYTKGIQPREGKPDLDNTQLAARLAETGLLQGMSIPENITTAIIADSNNKVITKQLAQNLNLLLERHQNGVPLLWVKDKGYELDEDNSQSIANPRFIDSLVGIT